MAFGAADDPRLAFEAGRIAAAEARAMGVHVNFAPVVDVNNNPRNPVINIRSFGEDPERVGALAAAYIEGLRAGGMLATVKHFPGHGDTDVDSHIGLPIIHHPRERLDRIELVPFRAGFAAGGPDAVMTAHIELPALDPAPATPATFSRPVVEGLLRGELAFDGLVFTDSMRMRAVSELAPAGPGRRARGDRGPRHRAPLAGRRRGDRRHSGRRGGRRPHGRTDRAVGPPHPERQGAPGAAPGAGGEALAALPDVVGRPRARRRGAGGQRARADA